jgi:glycosyltransferase involved in cell wall biosynthesis
MSKTKKIGLLIPHLQSGGAERVLSITSTILEECGYEVFLFLYDTDNISYKYSGKIIDMKSKAGRNIVTKIISRFLRIIKLSYYKHKFDIDAVISFLYSANIVNYYSIGKSKKILACRGYGDYIENGKKYSKMMRKIDSFIVQTERMKSDFICDFTTDISKINVLYNPFDLNQIRERASGDIEIKIQKFIESHKTICTLGAFKKDKGYWNLIKSFKLVKKSIKNAGLIFIGHRGEMEENIREMARLSGVADDILFIGYQENPFKYISKCDLYVCSSIYEGFPNALVEAIACGTPVISTDCKTGPREILYDNYHSEFEANGVSYANYGVLVGPFSDNPDFDLDIISNSNNNLANAICELFINKDLYEGYKSSSYKAVKRFDFNSYKKQLVEIIETE